MTKKQIPTTARVDRATSDSGLFHVLPKGTVRLKATEHMKELETPNGPIRIDFVTAYLLDDTDLRIYLAAVGMMSDEHELIYGKNPTGIQKNLWDQFLLDNVPLVTYPSAPRVRTTVYALCKAAGLSWNGDAPKRIYDSLKRISAVSSRWTLKDRVMSCNMMGFAYDMTSQELSLSVSPLFASAILGEARQYVKVNLDEMRELKQPASSILHLIFSARLGSRQRDVTVKIDTLCASVYGFTEESSTLRNRRRNIREALDELDKLDLWHVSYNMETGKANIGKNTPKSVENRMRASDRIEKEINDEDGDDD